MKKLRQYFLLQRMFDMGSLLRELKTFPILVNFLVLKMLIALKQSVPSLLHEHLHLGEKEIVPSMTQANLHEF